MTNQQETVCVWEEGAFRRHFHPQLGATHLSSNSIKNSTGWLVKEKKNSKGSSPDGDPEVSRNKGKNTPQHAFSQKKKKKAAKSLPEGR